MNANSHDINVMKGISIALMILLIVAIFKLPYGYYTFLRIITTLGTGFLIFKTYSMYKTNDAFIWGLIIILILWNPVIPVYLTKSIWRYLNSIAAAFFLVFTIKLMNKHTMIRKFFMRYFLGVILFPFCWVFMYLYRIIWCDIICGIPDLFKCLFTNFLFFLIYLVFWPISVIIDIPIGLLVTFFSAINISKEIMSGEFSTDTISFSIANQNNRFLKDNKYL
jgi:hypothetical protein